MSSPRDRSHRTRTAPSPHGPPVHDTDAAADARLVLDSFRHFVRALRVIDREAGAAVGLSGAQLFVLARLAAAPTPLSVNDLAACTFTDQSSVSVVVTRLVSRGLVSRRRASDDARRAMLTATARGRALLARAPAPAQDALITALLALAPAERRVFAATLAHVVEHLRPDDRPAPLFFEEPAKLVAVTRPATTRKTRRAPAE